MGSKKYVTRLAVFSLFLVVGLVFSASKEASSLEASSLEDLVGRDRAGALIRGETLTELQFKASRPLLIPQNDFVRQLVTDIREDLEPSLFVESLFLYKKPAGAELPRWSPAEREALFNEALALSTLAGLQYYSSSRKTLRTFYETSVVIDGPDTRRPLPDPAYGPAPKTPLPIPAELTIYARQKDLTFGDNIYQYTYHAREDSLVFIQRNLTAMNAGIIPAVGRNRLRSVVAVFDAGEYLLLFLSSMARAASFPGRNERVGRSFSTRAEAILQWVTGQADKAFGKPGNS
ncbi:MAG: hypothetical protein LBP43_04465 [Treponema sp.]|jgi:hypothetical protein|nr:hypothetical protein [Treponema sp.]